MDSIDNKETGYQSDPASWRGDSFTTSRSWVNEFDPPMLAEIDDALAQVRGDGLAWPQLSPANFKIPRTARLLADLQAQLDRGKGFCVLGGFPVDQYSYEDNRMIYCGIASHFGTVVPQTGKGEMMIDVTDVGKAYDHRSRGYSSNSLLPFHTDGADIAGLFCLEVAAEGGASILVSAAKVYEILKADHPTELATLEKGFYHHRRGEQPAGDGPLSSERIPVFQFHDGLLHAMYNRNPIEWVRHEGVQLSQSETDALDRLDATLASPALQLKMEMQKGDMQFINNFVIFHSRTEYRDSPERRRHLLRLWLNLPRDSGRRNGPTLLDLYSPQSARKS